jgi:hypothetical protein
MADIVMLSDYADCHLSGPTTLSIKTFSILENKMTLSKLNIIAEYNYAECHI